MSSLEGLRFCFAGWAVLACTTHCSSSVSSAPPNDARASDDGAPTVSEAAAPVTFDAPSSGDVGDTRSPKDAAPTGSVCAPVRAQGDAPLVDDFEAKSGQILSNEGRGGWWFSYDDGTAGKLLREKIAVAATEGQGRVLHVAASAFSKWGAGFGATLRPSTSQTNGCSYDASTYSGVRFRARGHGRIRMMLAHDTSTPAAQGGSCTLSDDRCNDNPGVTVDLGDSWKTYEYPFCSFLPEGWGGSTAGLDPSTVFSFQFRVKELENVEVWLDDLAFYRADAAAPKPRCGLPCPLDAAPPSAKIEPHVSSAPLSQELSLHTFEQETKSCGPLTRRYLSYVPSRLGPRSSAPVLIMLHGTGANAESARTFMTRDRFDTLAARDGFVVVYGNAAPGMYTSTDLSLANSGTWRHGFVDDGEVDDANYLERVLGDLVTRDVIDGNNSVFITGMSNGGGMVLEAAKRMPNRFRGIAALMPYDGDPPTPVPDLSSTKLRRVLIAYAINDPGLTGKYHETIAPMPAQWAAAMGVPKAVIAAPQQTTLLDAVIEGEGYLGSNQVALATRNSQVTQLDMVAPSDDAQVRVLVLDHAGHFWPTATQDTEAWILNRWGFRNQDFDAADMVWDYLSAAGSGQ